MLCLLNGLHGRHALEHVEKTKEEGEEVAILLLMEERNVLLIGPDTSSGLIARIRLVQVIIDSLCLLTTSTNKPTQIQCGRPGQNGQNVAEHAEWGEKGKPGDART